MDSKSRNDISDLFVRMPERRWRFLQTRPRHEKQALSDLTAQGLIVYLPLITKVEIHNRGKRERQLPMFQGYLFACPSLVEEPVIRHNKYVWNFRKLSEGDEESLIKDLKIVRECELLSAKHKLIVNPQLKVGDTVVMKTGPFKGLEVIVLRRKNESTVIVNLMFFGRSIEIQCNADDLTY